MISNEKDKPTTPEPHNPEEREEKEDIVDKESDEEKDDEYKEEGDQEHAPTPLSIPPNMSFPSPPLSTPFVYYNPPFSAPRHFNRHNHILMNSNKTFPEKLHEILDGAAQSGLSDVISFFSHGRAFKIHMPRRFVSEIMPRFFKQTKLTSFQRQLNLYGFKRISKGPENGGYYHPYFVQGQPHLTDKIKRQVQSKATRGKSQEEAERKMTPPTSSGFLPPYPATSYYSYPSAPSLAQSYYTTPMMGPPDGSYSTPYGYPYMYSSGWPAPYGGHPAYTPRGYPIPPSAAPPTAMAPLDSPIGSNTAQVSPEMESLPNFSFTPIKLSSTDSVSWTPGGLCIDD